MVSNLEELQRHRAEQRKAEAAEPAFNPAQPILHERHIMRQLQEAGWIGKPSQLRALAYWGENLRQRYENECSHAWAGNSERYKDGTQRVEAHIVKLAREAGLSLFVQGDCRGATVYVCAPGENMTDSNYSTHGKALHYGRGE